eukprot:4935500-Pyramimonas_sp.AAC.1
MTEAGAKEAVVIPLPTATPPPTGTRCVQQPSGEWPGCRDAVFGKRAMPPPAVLAQAAVEISDDDVPLSEVGLREGGRGTGLAGVGDKGSVAEEVWR